MKASLWVELCAHSGKAGFSLTQRWCAGDTGTQHEPAAAAVRTRLPSQRKSAQIAGKQDSDSGEMGILLLFVCLNGSLLQCEWGSHLAQPAGTVGQGAWHAACRGRAWTKCRHAAPLTGPAMLPAEPEAPASRPSSSSKRRRPQGHAAAKSTAKSAGRQAAASRKGKAAAGDPDALSLDEDEDADALAEAELAAAEAAEAAEDAGPDGELGRGRCAGQGVPARQAEHMVTHL